MPTCEARLPLWLPVECVACRRRCLTPVKTWGKARDVSCRGAVLRCSPVSSLADSLGKASGGPKDHVKLKWSPSLTAETLGLTEFGWICSCLARLKLTTKSSQHHGESRSHVAWLSSCGSISSRSDGAEMSQEQTPRSFATMQSILGVGLVCQSADLVIRAEATEVRVRIVVSFSEHSVEIRARLADVTPVNSRAAGYGSAGT